MASTSSVARSCGTAGAFATHLSERDFRPHRLSADLGSGFDAAIATLSSSVMAAVDRAVDNVRGAPSVGAPLGVLDLRQFPGGPWRLFAPVVRRLIAWYADWNPDGDVSGAVELPFDRYEVVVTGLWSMPYSTITRDEWRKNSREPRSG